MRVQLPDKDSLPGSRVRVWFEGDFWMTGKVVSGAGGIEIRGSLWAHPIPLEMLLRTDVDLETGEVRIHDLEGPLAR